MGLTVHQFPCLEDNYGFLVHDEATGIVACIDTPDADAVLGELAAKQWQLDFILNTHWHGDHIGGNEKLRGTTGALIVGPQEVCRKSPVDRVVHPGDLVEIGATRFDVLDTGGHTSQHVSYYDAADRIVFVGDTLFAMGCGRLFEGTPEQMWTSLMRLAELPPEVTVYCAHEYTESNARFALMFDDSRPVRERFDEIVRARSQGEWTVPTTIGVERETNPFLRARLLVPNLDPVAAFAKLRSAKDGFVG
ncbi:MAG TPA: hydroxyacylglutathione hydrolase [Sphingomicrobium sp.]|nr:hydroxyacylglutathione hydrolase [Sphingomicrobium sp.]